MVTWKGWLCAAMVACAWDGSTGLARAQNYPERPVTLIIPFAPGGSTSIVGRVIADKMSETLGEKIIVDNRAGAGGTVGTRAVAKSAPDGYTIGLGYTGTLAIGPTLYTKAGYDPRKDFAPIGMIGNSPNSLVVHPSFPAKTVAELIAYAKANPASSISVRRGQVPQATSPANISVMRRVSPWCTCLTREPDRRWST